MQTNKFLIPILCLTLTQVALAASVSVPMQFTSGPDAGKSAGIIQISETKFGLMFTPNLQGLKAEAHGFHIHQIPSCAQNAMAAGGHLDPKSTGLHQGPFNDTGHLGDLPALCVAADGTVTGPVLAPRLKHLAEVENHALMIHEGGDNYSDSPQKLGGGGGRMICGVIK